MKNSTEHHLELFNRKGKQYRKMILLLTDEELRKIFPIPSEALLRQLRKKIVHIEQFPNARS